MVKNVTLFQHQKKAIESCSKVSNRLIYRLPGTGKTLIGIELVKKEYYHNNKSLVLWICPANLIDQCHENFHDYELKYNDIFPAIDIVEGMCNICSYDMLRLNLSFFARKSFDLVICDEFHKAKNDKAKTNHALWKIRKYAKKWYAFTGTPFQNTPYEFFELISLCLCRHISFECEQMLQYRFPKFSPVRNFLRRLGIHLNRLNQGTIVGIKDPQKLHDMISEVVDYVKPENYLYDCHLPNVKYETLLVEMTTNEVEEYKKIHRSILRNMSYENFTADKLEDEKIDGSFKKLSNLRIISLKESKIFYAANMISSILKDNRKAQILVFCNFVEKGLKHLSIELNKRGYKHLVYNGKVTFSKRKEFIQDYLSGRNNVLLLSPVGFEGLDLYGTTHIIILDPHYNPERTKQLTSRAIRAFSKVEKIRIIQLISQSSKLNFPLIDSYILKIAERKANIAQMIEDTLSIE